MATKGKEHPFKNLLSPLKIGPVEVKNRIALSPMNETLSDAYGEATEQMICYYAARAKGGAGLLICGAVMGTEMCLQVRLRQKPALL